MANIKPYTDAIANAVYGEEVRGSIINSLNAVNDDNESYQEIKKTVVECNDKIQDNVQQFNDLLPTAETLKTNLDDLLSDADSIKTDLNNAILNSKTSTQNLSSFIEKANVSKANLETSIENSKTKIDEAALSVEKILTKANSVNSTLSNSIDDGKSINTLLHDTTLTANTSRGNLKSVIDEANSSKTELQDVINDSDLKKTELSAVIATANTSKLNIDNSVSSADELLSKISEENETAKANITRLESDNFNAQEILDGVNELKTQVEELDENKADKTALNDYVLKTYLTKALKDKVDVGTYTQKMSQLKTSIASKFDSSNVESGTGEFTVSEQYANQAKFDYLRIGNTVILNIRVYFKAQDDYTSGLALIGLPFVANYAETWRTITQNTLCSTYTINIPSGRQSTLYILRLSGTGKLPENHQMTETIIYTI